MTGSISRILRRTERSDAGLPTGAVGLAVAALAAAAGLVSACQSPPPRKHPHVGIETLWRQYVALPDEKALVIAGDPDRLWVAGAAGGEETRRDAARKALGECKARRLERRLQVPCRVYAMGDRIVWKDW